MKNIKILLLVFITLFICQYSFAEKQYWDTQVKNKEYSLIKDMIINEDYLKAHEKLIKLLNQPKWDYDGNYILSILYYLLQDDKEINSKLNDWLTKYPDHHTVHIIKGRYLIDYAWEARKAGWAYTVTKDGWKKFKERINESGKHFLKAWELNNNDPCIGSYMITVCRADSSKSKLEMEEWFTRAINLIPQYPSAYERKLIYLYPKWHGSQEEVDAFIQGVLESDYANIGYRLVLNNQRELIYRSKDVDRAWREKKGEQSNTIIKILNLYPHSLYYINKFFYYSDKKNGLKYLKKSAEAGNRQTQYNLGLYLQFNEKNLETAKQLYKKAAEQGLELAEYRLKFPGGTNQPVSEIKSKWMKKNGINNFIKEKKKNDFILTSIEVRKKKKNNRVLKYKLGFKKDPQQQYKCIWICDQEELSFYKENNRLLKEGYKLKCKNEYFVWPMKFNISAIWHKLKEKNE